MTTAALESAELLRRAADDVRDLESPGADEVDQACESCAPSTASLLFDRKKPTETDQALESRALSAAPLLLDRKRPTETDQACESRAPSTAPVLLHRKKAMRSLEWGTPFVASLDDGVALDDLLVAQPTSLLREMLNDPRALAERLLDGRAGKTMTDTALTLVVTSGLAGAALGTATGGSALRSMALLPVALVLAVIAALGPVAASAVMVGARVPWSLLAGALTMATTRGAMVLCASAPLAVLAMRVDSEWAGPLVILTSFAVSGLLSGRLIRSMLEQAALVVWQRAGSSLGGERLERVALVGRVGLVQLAFTLSIAVWSFKILG